MIFSRRYLALDLRQRELRAVCLTGRQSHPLLQGARLLALDAGVVHPSLREPNILDPLRLTAAIREVLDPLAGKEERLALILPESIGRMLLVEVETPFSSSAEAEKILKWQLKGSLPAEADGTVLDFQILDQREDGRKRILVAATPRNILEQYESIVTAAGYFPELVGFHSQFLHNFYRNRIELPDEVVLLTLESGLFSFEYTQGHLPLYHRFREVGEEPAAIFPEISRALVGAQESHPGLKRAEVFLQCDLADPEPYLEIFRAVFQREVSLLDPHIDRMAAADASWPRWRLRGLAAAVGAAEQMM